MIKLLICWCFIKFAAVIRLLICCYNFTKSVAVISVLIFSLEFSFDDFILYRIEEMKNHESIFHLFQLLVVSKMRKGITYPLSKGHFVTCSKDLNSELFFAVLGGLGQFGIINRARIVLAKAPTRVKWVKMLYHDFSIFTRDQEQLISIKGPDYLEGYLMMDYIPVNEWRSPFFTPYNESQISSLLKKYGILYGLEMVKYYDDETANLVDKEVQRLQDGLNSIPGFSFTRDVTYVDFLNRVRQEEIALRSGGLWDVPHPWLNLFVPKSHIMDFNAGVFVDILHSKKMSKGPLLVYPTTKTKWDDRMSAVTPDEDIFYLVGILQAGSFDNWQELDNINNEILEFCNRAGINIKQYLPHYTSEEDWIKHFGSKWNTFRERKARFDPRMILSPGQKVFDSV
ncbi:cytokinin dehydrogenase 3-like [Olea europaea var. sylvestris]|uniref:cytokinin dehydrogenase 3-like n=1 Tax=Olea europaea var. sylvestris TaxID=158386 RepID=UPI000C1D3B81|nr:cytokinin dehydrogenase 3-like [Olea europaea var. sylvestris]